MCTIALCTLFLAVSCSDGRTPGSAFEEYDNENGERIDTLACP